MRVERINDIERFKMLKSEWNMLRGGPGLPSLPFAHEWFSCWLGAFGRDIELILIALFDESTLVGIAPLCMVRGSFRGIPCRQLKFLYNRHGPRCTFLMKEGYGEYTRVLLDEAFKLPGWDITVFENIPHESYLYGIVAGLPNSLGYSALLRKTMSSPFLKIEGSWEEFFNSRSRNFKRSLRKKESRLSNAGKMTIEHFTDAASATAIMDTLFAVGEKSWKARRNRAIGSGVESRRFYSLLAETFGKQGEVSVWLMRINGEPAAFEFHLVRGKKVQALRAEFDEKYRDLGAGSVLDKEIVKRLFELGFEEYDMGGEADFYKLRWSDGLRDHSELLVFGRSAIGRLLCVGEKGVVEPLKRVLHPLRKQWTH